MKQFFKRLLFKDKGSVSVFAILIILPIFLLNALFIDTARIFSAERQIENGIDTALRSTMAEFNEELASVGLFSYSGSQSEVQSDFRLCLDEQM
ncbi:Flp pilus assembly protein TadG [Virgibacillus natechei]|uniref:Flp pilus assembly protein TadG n=1 Tax=Virgibacillus natechei TaxID=1216297 RepID=A0ABS4ICR4_9BACI|nr:pilus assembly protein TadG-related protein [Virgibacillus natechei]MBP1968648.1 Flp pilus assembly protein TadG [Virgibacillus natechei]UZD13753.1 pilus assembly protein TadG-related protein [Virgibacillus natechei]